LCVNRKRRGASKIATKVNEHYAGGMESMNNRLSLALIVCLATSGFAQDKPKNSDIENIGRRNINQGTVNFISVEKEIAIGRQLSAEFERQMKLLQNFTINEYVNRLGKNVARNSDAQIPMTFKVVESDDVDGQAFPGGFVYVTAGTILAVDNEAELTSVLAQQIAHIAARHGTENASKAELVNFSSLPLVFQGGPAGFGVPVPAQFLETVRRQVREADFLGLQYLYKAGYEPRAAITFLQKLQGLKPQNSRASSSVFSMEPPAADRIITIQKNIDLILPPRAQNVLTTPEFDSIKTQLKR
jgi:predicted Zn-dependent protease